MLVRTHMEELKEHTNLVLYERYRSDKLLSMGVAQDSTVFKEIKCVDEQLLFLRDVHDIFSAIVPLQRWQRNVKHTR